MAYVYFLKGSNGRHYLGSTTDLERRLEEHRRGKTHTTQRLGTDIELLACKETSTLEEARNMELSLKKKKSPKLILWHLNQ